MRRLLDAPLRPAGHEIPAGWFAGQLALLEMRVIIREVVRRLELSATDQTPEARRLKDVTLAPAKLTRVIARARTPARSP